MTEERSIGFEPTKFDVVLRPTDGGVFISHISAEKPVALLMQKYLRLAFGQNFPVFVSTDQDSIGGGRKWFEYILHNLKTSKTLLVLVSEESSRREWINFEAGFGDGCGAAIIPVAIKAFGFDQLRFPLLGYNGRRSGDIEGIVADVTRVTGRIGDLIDGLQYREDLIRSEASLNYKSLTVAPIIAGNDMQFEITNSGNVDVELLMLEIYVPPDAIDNNWWMPGHIEPIGYKEIEGKNYRVFASYSPRGTLNVTPALRPYVTPSMNKYRPQLSFRVNASHPEFKQMKIWCQLHAIGYTTALESYSLSGAR